MKLLLHLLTSLHGPSRRIAACNSLVAVGGITDIGMRWSRKARVQMTPCETLSRRPPTSASLETDIRCCRRH